jgi:hypothetical protein
MEDAKQEKTVLDLVQARLEYFALVESMRADMAAKLRLEWGYQSEGDCQCVAEAVACGFVKIDNDEQLEFNF